MKKPFPILLLVALLTTLLLSGTATMVAGDRKMSLPLRASLVGNFQTGPLPGDFFSVTEGGIGSALHLGLFSSASFVVHDLSMVPPGCFTGVEGWGVMVFADGVMHLERLSAEACVDGAVVELVEEWGIFGGTHRYEDAGGGFTKELTGNMIEGTFEATLKGKIEF